jgi:hypothetical protein
MDKIILNQPYKITQRKHKQYIAHYNIPAERCIVVPLKKFGDQLFCDMKWKDSNEEIQVRNGLMMDIANLEAIDAMRDQDLYSLWEAHVTIL